MIPSAVAYEIAPSVGTMPSWIEMREPDAYPQFRRRIGSGERGAIALALQLPADIVVLDDAGARSSAIELGLSIIGSLGLLAKAKQRGLIGEVRPMMDAMIANGLFVSDRLRRDILAIADEPDQ